MGCVKAVGNEEFIRRGNRVAWAFVPYLALCQAVQLAYRVPGARFLTFELIALLVLALVTAPWWLGRRHELGKATGWLVASFLAVVVYGIVALPFHAPAVVTTAGGGVVPLQYLVVPLLNAGLATLTGLGMILAAEPRLRLRIIAAAGAASLVVAFIGWPFQSQYRRSIRLATGQGGAAVVHVIFLLLIAVGLAEFLRRGGNRKLGIGLMLGAMIATLATQSRGALLTLGAFVVLLALGWVLNGTRSIWKLWPLALALVLGVALAPLVPGFDRIFSLSDTKRSANLKAALGLWNEDWSTRIFGVGSGHAWPWPAYESGLYRFPPEGHSGQRPTAYGDLLLTPHSTPLALLVEHGLVGVLAGAVMGVAVLVLWWRSRASLSRLAVASAVLASLMAFLFDTYLLRNFGISLWWWACVALVATWKEPSPDDAPSLGGLTD